MHKLNDVPLNQLLIEHYLFDLGQSVEKTTNEENTENPDHQMA